MICPICCGTSREVTLTCPLDCQFLQEARKHERPPSVNPAEFPNQDIKLSENFLHENEALLLFLGRSVLEAGLNTPGAIDYDVRDALAALVRTYRTLESGIYYDTRPENAIAAGIYQRIQTGIAEFRRTETEHLHMTTTRDADVLGVLAFLQRLELDRNNGRKRGRSFLDFLRGQFPAVSAVPLEHNPPSLIQI
ncbi:MAG: hypothetical protein ABIZ80_15195 [Bryobacteraceae bacterium]